MTNRMCNVQTRRWTKVVASIACCVLAYGAAVSLSAHDQADAFRAPRSHTPAIAAVLQPSPTQATIARAVPPAVVNATIASTR